MLYSLRQGDLLSVQIVENWSDILAEVTKVFTSPDIDGFTIVEMFVLQVFEVENFDNLIGDAVGKDVSVNFPENLIESLGITAGSLISCRVRRASLTMNFVHREYIFVLDS